MMNIHIFRNTVDQLSQKQYHNLLKKNQHIISGIDHISAIYIDACKILNIKPVGVKPESNRESLLSQARFHPYDRNLLESIWYLLSDKERQQIMVPTEKKTKQQIGQEIWANVKQLAFDILKHNKR